MVTFDILINNQQADQLTFKADLLSESKCINLKDKLKNVEKPGSTLSVIVKPSQRSLSVQDQSFMMSVDMSYQADKPNDTTGSPLETSLSKVANQNTFIYTLNLQNKIDKEQGMVTWEFYKPTCMDFNLTDLENLKLQNQIDHFELLERNNIIVFYWRGLKSRQKRSL